MHVRLRLTVFAVAWLLGATGRAQDSSLVPGVVIDHSPKSSGKYIGSPSIAILPNGDYVASHDIFGPNSNEGGSPVSQIFRSTDRGQTWTHLADLNGQFWSNLFVYENDLYIMGSSKGYGRITIRKSTDGGSTWTNPTSSATGRLTSIEAYHTAPMPMVIHDGRIWRSFEDNLAGGGWGAHFRSLVMSTPLGSDLLNAANWTFSNALPRDTKWLGGTFGGWLEGNLVLTPEGKLVNVLRADNRQVAAMVDVDTASHTVSFSPETGFIDFPGGEKKFLIRYDAESEKYWALTGSGTIAGRVTNAAGKLAPGNSPGRLTILGDFQQEDGGVLEIEVAGASEHRYDVLAVTGEFRAGGTLEIVLADEFQPTAGDRFQILEFADADGKFDRLRLPQLGRGLAWDVRGLVERGGGQLTVVAVAVPEPASAGLLIPLVTLLAPIHRQPRGKSRWSAPFGVLWARGAAGHLFQRSF